MSGAHEHADGCGHFRGFTSTPGEAARDGRYTCSHVKCEKSFKTSSQLKSHMTSHGNERPYVCDFEHCGKAFEQKNDYWKHRIMVHTKELKLVCPVDGCGKVF